MMLEASVGGPAPGEFNEDLNHEGKAALVNCFIQAVSTPVAGSLLLGVYCRRPPLSALKQLPLIRLLYLVQRLPRNIYG